MKEKQTVSAKNADDIYHLIFKSGPYARLVNLITLYRIITFPLLIIFLFIGQLQIFKWLLLISFSTDAIDGFLSRRFHVASVLGAKLDSIGDDLTVLAATIGLIKVYPQFIEEQAVIFILLVLLFFIQMFYALIRYGKTTSFHTYLAKTAAVLQGAFLLSAFFFGQTFDLLFYLTAFVTAVELVEEIIIVSLLKQWKSNVKGIYWVIKN